jgi:hypothetical protein
VLTSWKVRRDPYAQETKFHDARRIDLDRDNIIAIDVRLYFFRLPIVANCLLQINHYVRPDSNLTLQAAIEVVEEEGFEDLLNNVRDRIDEIESLHRTRELTVRPRFSSSCSRT